MVNTQTPQHQRLTEKLKTIRSSSVPYLAVLSQELPTDESVGNSYDRPIEWVQTSVRFRSGVFVSGIFLSPQTIIALRTGRRLAPNSVNL
jgi:hypothetical protein